jgi:Helicase conserved C-terminal domain
MSYGWGRASATESRNSFEKAYQRQSLADWDARWHELSGQARYFFLNVVKGPLKGGNVRSIPPSVALDAFPAHVLKELVDAGFVVVQAARSKAFTDRVVAGADLYDFATRVRLINRLHLLAVDQPSQLEKYVDSTIYGAQLPGILFGVLRKVGIEDYIRAEEALQRYVMHRHWPGWVARSLNSPLAERIIDVFQKADGPIPLADVAGRLKGSDPGKVRSALDELIGRLALFEDLRPETWELMVGFLPSVREELTRANLPRERPPLIAIDPPEEVGPEGSVIVDDLRAFLLEVAGEPPRLRQDETLFHKEIERFKAPLEPLAPWFSQAVKWTHDSRLSQALAWARALGLVKNDSQGKELRLDLAPKGHKWLASGLDEQYAGVFNFLLAIPGRNDEYAPHLQWFHPTVDRYNGGGLVDTRFLGEFFLVLKAGKGKHTPYWDSKPEDLSALRQALDRALSMLKPGVFYRLDSVESHLVFKEHNPLNRGLAPDQVAVFWANRVVPPLEEQREEAGLTLLDAFIRRRLIPLGCVRAAIDKEGRLGIARQPRYDALFGRKVAPADMAPAATSEARVVVQPDFSVIVIGLNPTPAAELAPFCERTSRGGGQGALILKITRESVVKAVSQGLKPAEILDRLQRHASNEVPANVLKEVQEWSQWVRQVATSTLSVLRCPDRDTADRVMSALKRQGERLTDTLVAINQKRLTAADRTKLKSRGILVQDSSDARETKPKKGRRR